MKVQYHERDFFGPVQTPVTRDDVSGVGGGSNSILPAVVVVIVGAVLIVW